VPTRKATRARPKRLAALACFVPSAASLTIPFSVAAFLACAPAPPHAAPLRTQPQARPTPERWPSWEQAQAWPSSGPDRFSSAHFGRAFEAQIRVSPSAHKAYELAGQPTWPEDAAVLELLWQGDALRGGLVIERRPTPTRPPWRFMVLSPAGELLAAEAAPGTSLCSACHSSAREDFLFRPPKDEDPARPGLEAP
jgi:hypothetical protein